MLPKNQTKNLSDVHIGQMKIARNTQMHAEFKWREQNAELKKGLISKTFQNSSKSWYFRIRTKKKKREGYFIWPRIQMQIIWEKMTTSTQNKTDYYSDTRLWLCPMKKTLKIMRNTWNAGWGLKMAIVRLCITSLHGVKSHSTYTFAIYHCTCFLENFIQCLNLIA